MKLPFCIMLCVAMNAGSSIAASATANNDVQANYIAAKNNAAMQYKINRAKCDALTGNPKEVCVAQAKADQTHARSEAEALVKGTAKARANARKEIANANYEVAHTRCNKLTGNDNAVCIKEAKSSRIAAIADAKADLKVSDIRKEAAEDKIEAEYKVAKEKCDGFSGEAKHGCLKQIKTRFSR